MMNDLKKIDFEHTEKKKKTIVEINSCNFASTGNIMINIAEEARKKGYRVFVCCPYSGDNKRKKALDQVFIGDRITRNIHRNLSYLTGFNGCFSVVSTIAFIRKLNDIKPDLIHLHNLHNSYINLPLFFRYLKKSDVPVVWTFHDCWPFTGKCPYYTYAECEKWKKGCYDCKHIVEYPASKVDRTKKMWLLKKAWFTQVDKLRIITPSQWLKDQVKESYFRDLRTDVIHNGIDISVFHPYEEDYFNDNYGTGDKKIVLGVALPWSKRKGIDTFIKLSHYLEKEFQIVLVGTDENVDKMLPESIISIHRTNNQTELARMYSSADVFVNPTLEDNYPTVNMESIACGTPVITYNTGGSPESIDEYTGAVVEQNDIDDLIANIKDICRHKTEYKVHCIKKAQEFDKCECFKKYIDLYDNLV